MNREINGKIAMADQQKFQIISHQFNKYGENTKMAL